MTTTTLDMIHHIIVTRNDARCILADAGWDEDVDGTWANADHAGYEANQALAIELAKQAQAFRTPDVTRTERAVAALREAADRLEALGSPNCARAINHNLSSIPDDTFDNDAVRVLHLLAR